MKQKVVEEVRQCKAFGLLTDEVADISVTENLITFIQFFSSHTQEVETRFLSCQNILEEFSSANAEAISSLLFKELKSNGLDVASLPGFTSDGAKVMLGQNNGVAAKLRQQNPILLNIHCVCHRLALACTDSNEELSYIKNVDLVLRQLWQFFENSPKRMAVYLKTQAQLKAVLLGEPTKKVIVKKLKKACRTRWLSLDASLTAVFKDFLSILQTLSLLEKEEATACGLLKKMRCLKFIGVIYILHDILPILSTLSRHFQKGLVNYAAISPALILTKVKLKNLVEENTPLEKLKSDIDSFADQADIRMSSKDAKDIEKLFETYVNALTSNIDNRFRDSSDVLASFSIFDPLAVPTNADDFKTYGKRKVEILASHFFQQDEPQEKTCKGDKLLTQWQGMKYHFKDNLKLCMPDDIRNGTAKTTSTEWCLMKLLGKRSLKHFFPELVYIAEVVASLPVSNAWPER